MACYQSKPNNPYRYTAALVACSMVVSSCVSTRQDRIGADDGSDPCRGNVVALDSTGNFFGEDLLQGALVGAAAGAVAGGLLAAMQGKKKDVGKSALVGAAVGGVAGALGGYYKNQMQKGRDQAILAINQDLEKEGAQLDKADLAIKELMACRIRQRDRIRADYAAKRITRDQAQAQWALLQQQVGKDKELMRLVTENIGKRHDEYKYANEQMAAEFDISKLPPAEQQKVKAKIAASNQTIEQEHRQETARIDQEIAKKKQAASSGKKKDAKQVAALDQERKERLAVAKKVAEQKKIINEKTGGNTQMAANTSALSANQAKKESIKVHEQEFAKNLSMEDGGFEKISFFPIPADSFLSWRGVCPLGGEGRVDLGWNHWPVTQS
ncbi:MAG: hypothetical protein HQM03_04085 [Magnetococcales bacterium]|nr:hypothetical protein [Magnetococcales bacterium]